MLEICPYRIIHMSVWFILVGLTGLNTLAHHSLWAHTPFVLPSVFSFIKYKYVLVDRAAAEAGN